LVLRKTDTDPAKAISAVRRRLVGIERHAQLVGNFGITREMPPDI